MATQLKRLELNTEERNRLVGYSSLCFGFLIFGQEKNAVEKALIEKAIHYYTNLIKIHGHISNVDCKEHQIDKDAEKASNIVITENGVKKEVVSEESNECQHEVGEVVPANREPGKDNAKRAGCGRTLKNGSRKVRALDNWIFCRLGHLHLLLEQFPKALSAYQKYYTLEKCHWKDTSFLYGLGLVYFHYNKYNWCIHLFYNLLYVNRAFQPGVEVHIRLGLMFQVLKNYGSCVKHFKLCLSDAGQCTLSYPERRIHLCHLLEVQTKYVAAKESYESFLQLENLDFSLKATALRQLGWLYHRAPQLGEKVLREQLAIKSLSNSVDLDPCNGQTWYMLGRCYSKLNQVHDAFVSYRQSIDKSEANADTWCSIGVLYQQQSQPMDALQAYICAVQLDKGHSAAWTDLAVLYESCNQPSDALACYLNAIRNRDNVSPEILAKIKFLQQNTNNIPMPNLHKPRQLPSIEEAWRLPIPAELTSRQNNAPGAVPQPHEGLSSTNVLSRQQSFSPEEQSADKKKNRKRTASKDNTDPSTPSSSCQSSGCASSPPLSPPTPPFLGPTQMQLLQYLLSNREHLNAQQQQLLHQLQQQLALSEQHRQQHHHQQQQTDRVARGCAQSPLGEVVAQEVDNLKDRPLSFSSTMASPFATGSLQDCSASYVSLGSSMTSHLHSSSSCERNFRTDEEMVSYFHHHDQLLNEDRRQHFQHLENTGNIIGPLPVGMTGSVSNWMSVGASSSSQLRLVAASQVTYSSPNMSVTLQSASSASNMSAANVSAGHAPSCSLAAKLGTSFVSGGRSDCQPPAPVPYVYQKDDLKLVINLRSALAPPTPPDGCCSKSATVGIPTCTGLSSALSNASSQLAVVPSSVCGEGPSDGKAMSIRRKQSMTSQEIIDSVKGCKVKITISLKGDNIAPPAPPPAPFPPLSKDLLNPPTPSIYLENKKDALSPALQHYCHSQPVVIIRGIASVLKLDLGLFSTKTLVEANPDHQMEVRTQKQQSPDENRDRHGNMVWYCCSSRSHTAISHYADYQATSFQECLKEEQERSRGLRQEKEFDSDSNTSSAKKKGAKKIKFGTNVDLSDTDKWRPQLAELTKLPAFIRVVSGSNLLSHVGHRILGMNTVQLYMKVPGSRTPGHQENNNLCSVNINIGPGDCEWFAVPDDYWGVIASLCENNNVDYLRGSWWPNLDDLYNHNMPVYRFVQKPGDLVWIGPGTVHWVQAIGWCNNIAWNVGPMTYHQYKLAIDRYEYNRLQHYKSIVPMLQLTWHLARSLRTSDAMLYNELRFVCQRSLMQQQLTMDLLRDMDKPMTHRSRLSSEETYYCEMCEDEVFNILYVKKNPEGESFYVYCQNCALKSSPDLSQHTVLYQYEIGDLMRTYDSFVMFQPPHNYHPS